MWCIPLADSALPIKDSNERAQTILYPGFVCVVELSMSSYPGFILFVFCLLTTVTSRPAGSTVINGNEDAAGSWPFRAILSLIERSWAAIQADFIAPSCNTPMI